MFRKEENKFILDLKKEKTTFVSGTAEERVKILNDAQQKGLGTDIRFDIIRIDTEEIAEKSDLEPGIYRYIPANYSNPEMLTNQVLTKRSYSHFPEAFQSMDLELDWFITNQTFFSEIGIRRSRSVLLWGPPGYSKTAKIHDTVLKQDNAISIFMNQVPSSEFVTALNASKLDKIIIFEEFATCVNNDKKIAEMLNFLDGDNSLDNAFFIITTNHPEIIPRNILRPSRVDKFIKIDKLTKNDINKFLEFYLKREPLESEIELMKNQSLANLREICISSLKEKVNLVDAVKLLKDREKLLERDFASERKMGLIYEED